MDKERKEIIEDTQTKLKEELDRTKEQYARKIFQAKDIIKYLNGKEGREFRTAIIRLESVINLIEC